MVGIKAMWAISVVFQGAQTREEEAKGPKSRFLSIVFSKKRKESDSGLI